VADLYSQGWRQGSIFELELALPGFELDGFNKPSLRSRPHSRWVVCTQDCDLEGSDGSRSDPCIELRALLSEDPPANWGIRSRKFLLTTTEYVESDLPRVSVSPQVLSNCTSPEAFVEQRAMAFKTWLGRRYDRPAVPPEFVDLARQIASLCEKRKSEIRDKIHDVLIRFDPSKSPVHVDVFAVLTDDADASVAREWLADCLIKLRDAVVEQIEVGTRSEVSLEFLENSFSADLSQLTWRGETSTGG
jgi:hypothetical protein